MKIEEGASAASVKLVILCNAANPPNGTLHLQYILQLYIFSLCI